MTCNTRRTITPHSNPELTAIMYRYRSGFQYSKLGQKKRKKPLARSILSFARRTIKQFIICTSILCILYACYVQKDPREIVHKHGDRA